MRKADSQLILREAAQCPDEDEDAFQDIGVHQYFNTNNLWIRLDLLRAFLDNNNGLIPLPMIKNKKTVNPKDDSSTKVLQLETAMGAAIECFTGSSAVVVPRDRFAPVKKCNDLLLLRSDAYTVEGGKIVLAPGIPEAPTMSLGTPLASLLAVACCRLLPCTVGSGLYALAHYRQQSLQACGCARGDDCERRALPHQRTEVHGEGKGRL